MNLVPRLRHQQIVFFGIIVIIIFFFWNVSLFSDRLCQNELEKAIEEKSSILAVLKNQIQALEDEKAKGFEDQNNLLNKLKNQLQSLKDKPPSGQSNPRIGIILYTYNRPDYLKRTLTTLMKYLPPEVPLVISQDSDNQEVSSLIKEYKRALHIKNHPRESIHKRTPGEPDSYYYISSHYKFGLQQVFDRLLFDAVIIIEDDMEISPDFFDYFQSLYPLLKYDDTLFCVSAWNDNGQSKFVKNADVLYRSDFFPGLGWMLTRDFWEEIKDKWPGAYWDDWLREPEQRKDRDCIRPEISRTYTFGKEGSSMGQFYEEHLANIKLNSENINWGSKDLSYLNKDAYDKEYDQAIDNCIEISGIDDISKYQDKSLVLYYDNQNQFTLLADRLEIMSDHKAGVPRTGYSTKKHKDCVTFWKNTNQLFMCQS